MSFGFSFGFLRKRGSSLPPVSSKLVIWAKGTLQDGATVEFADPDAEWGDPNAEWGFYRRDSHKVLGDFPLFIEANGDALTNNWDTVNATYIINPAYLVALTADLLEGPFLNIARTQAEIEAHVIGKGSVFFNSEFLLYNEVLVGSELTDVQAYIGS